MWVCTEFVVALVCVFVNLKELKYNSESKDKNHTPHIKKKKTH